MLTDKLLTALWNNEDTLGIEGMIAAEEGLELVQGLKSGYGVTVGWNTPDTLAYQLMEYNLFDFSQDKTEARLAAMTDLLIDKEKNQIRSFDDFKKLASKQIGKFNEEWLLTEYNLSIAVGQNSAQYYRFLADADDFPYVKYQTVGDSRVRNQHAKLEGKIFNLHDKTAMKLFPPNGYGCRCEFVQLSQKPRKHQVTKGDDGILLMQEADPRWKDSQFEINRGDLKQVFTQKQFYSGFKGLPEKLNQRTFDKYNLKKWAEFKEDLKPIKLDQTLTADNVKELFKKVGTEDFMRFKDYFGRKIMLKEKTFKKHTSGKYVTKSEKRHQLFPKVKEALNNPDEVWYNTQDKLDRKFQSRYIKFYQDMVLIVDCRTTNNGLEVLTWYEAKKEDQGLRKGLLIRGGKR